MIQLVAIDVSRDAQLLTDWINASGGAHMLQLMGMLVPNDYITTIEKEIITLQSIIDNNYETAWMIQIDKTIVGIVEVHTAVFEGLPSPSIGIMIGDKSARGRGLGTEVIRMIIQTLFASEYNTVYARALTHNYASLHMLAKAGFVKDGTEYIDKDGLCWQNYLKTR